MSLTTETDVAVIPNEATPERLDFHQTIRRSTRPCHDEVDALFGQFDLADRSAYADFLSAHAAALIPVEEWLQLASLGLPASPRSNALRVDLLALGRPQPAFNPLTWPDREADRWGAAYVIEGSRLGGAMLLRNVPQDYPRAYLGSVHPSGNWRAFLAALQTRANEGGSSWQEDALVAAQRTFTLYRDSAIAMGATLG